MGKARKALTTAMMLTFGACAAQPPSPAEMAMMQNAPKPTSQQAAEKAVIGYFADTLRDPDSAQYSFETPKRGQLIDVGRREFGWFMCGTLSAMNPRGRYMGARAFLAYFDPHTEDRVIDGALDRGRFAIVETWCEAIYEGE